MAHLWTNAMDGSWSVSMLDGQTVPLGSGAQDVGPNAGPVIAPFRSGDRTEWAVIAPVEARVCINGLPLPGGIRVLEDRDEIRAGGQAPVYFSAETLPAVVPFPGGERTVVCPRCRLPIEEGDMAVRCPRCGVWHHQSEKYPCWTYADTCAACGRMTDLTGSYEWEPEEE